MRYSKIQILLITLFFPLALYSQIDSSYLKKLHQGLSVFLEDTVKTSQKRSDSIAHYTHQITQIYKAEDNLQAWANAYFKAYMKDDIVRNLVYCDTILLHKWREPKDSLEVEIFLKNAYYGGFYKVSDEGDIYGALQYYEYAEQLYTKFPTIHTYKKNVRLGLANNYTRLGQNTKAIVIQKRHLADALAKDNANLAARISGNLSLTYMNEESYVEAIQVCEQALQFSNLAGFQKGLFYLRLSEAYLALQNHELANKYCLKAIELLEKSSTKDDYQVPKWLASAYEVYGIIQRQKGALETAQKWFEKSIQLALSNEDTEARGIAKTYNLLAQNYAQQGKLQEAIKTFNIALSTVIKTFQPSQIYENPTPKDLFEENTIFEALTGKAHALKQLYLENKDLKALESALVCHQLAYETEQLLRQTYQVESEKIALQADSRKREGEAIDVLFMLHQATQNTDYLTQAFQTAEQSKSTVLLDAIQTNFLQRDIATNDSLFVQQQQLKSYIAKYEKTLLSTKQTDALEAQLLVFKEELDAVNKRIRAKYPNHGRQIKSEIQLQDIGQMLAGKSDFLIEYFQSSDYLYIFVIDTKGQLSLERRALNNKLKTDLQQFKQLASNRVAFQNAPQQFYTLAHQLYEALLPVRIKDHIAKETLVRLSIIPDGTLNTCPFDALLTQVHTAGEIPFLVHKAQIDYAFSSNTLRYQQALKSPAKYTMLSMLPIFAEQERDLAPLQYSEFTAKELNYAHSKQLLKSKATLGNFLAQFQDFRILHFSTHAQADSASLVPSIEFIDSSLLLPEIYSLPIQADLVVLSACQTALGDTRSGEGLMSLARAFAYSGSPSLVATLWKVNNKSTSELVTAFYKYLSKGKSKSAALRFAKLDYLNNNALAQQNPYYWSGMVFIGADDVVDLQQATSWWWFGLLFLVLVSLLTWRFLKA